MSDSQPGRSESKRNALNAIRLLLALSVIVWHSFPLTGAPLPPHPVAQLLGEGGVDGFFAISGFLIVSSWVRRPNWWAFLKARFLRIFPAFWVCLIATALVIAPIGILLSGQGFPATYGDDSARYVLENAALRINEWGIGGTPTGVPYPGVWNGSLWTLWWEFLCYLAVLALGVTRLLRYRVTIPALFIACLAASVLVDVGATHNYYVVNGARFGLMFAAGALSWQLRNRIPARWGLVAACGAIVAAAAFLPDYRILAALPLAYALITTGFLVQVRALELRNDISYGTYIYAFPIQQVLACAGLTVIGAPLFAVAATCLVVALAAASWFAIEKPALRLRHARRALAPLGVSGRSAPSPRIGGWSE